MELIEQIISKVPSSKLNLFNQRLNPIFHRCFSEVGNNWTLSVQHIGADGCDLRTNPISGWAVTRYKKLLIIETAVQISTSARLDNSLCVNFYVNPNYKQDFESIIHDIVHQLNNDSEFQLSDKNIELSDKSPDKSTIVYVDPQRINELCQIESEDFDFKKLVRLCEEINVCYEAQAYYATGMLLRAILDHVPPVFRLSKFAEVSNNYSGGKSFKSVTQRLQTSSRDIADTLLHTQMRKKEILPTRTQIDFSSDLDLLLAEIIRLMSE